VGDLGCLHISEDDQHNRLSVVKERFDISELLFLSTCNRIEFLVCSAKKIDKTTLSEFLLMLYPDMTTDQLSLYVSGVRFYVGHQAINHLLRVAASIESMVVGEREIITQVRKAYELCKQNELTGDFIRLLIRHTLETTKQIYTTTDIAKKPVSIVSLAYHQLKNLHIPLDARILIVGAGTTNTNLSRFLKKHGFSNFVVFNRSLDKGIKLAQSIQGRAFALSDLGEFEDGFDVLISCTSSEQHIITPVLYERLIGNEHNRKIVIDLSIPQDLDPLICQQHKVTHISMEFLQKISNANLQERNKEVETVEAIIEEKTEAFEQLYRWRTIELALQDIPQKVRAIKDHALQKVYRSEIESMDESSKAVLDKVIGYIEKKYMNMPMIVAKDAFS